MTPQISQKQYASEINEVEKSEEKACRESTWNDSPS